MQAFYGAKPEINGGKSKFNQKDGRRIKGKRKETRIVFTTFAQSKQY